jgi:hypothetical protein
MVRRHRGSMTHETLALSCYRKVEKMSLSFIIQ